MEESLTNLELDDLFNLIQERIVRSVFLGVTPNVATSSFSDRSLNANWAYLDSLSAVSLSVCIPNTDTYEVLCNSSCGCKDPINALAWATLNKLVAELACSLDFRIRTWIG